MPIITFGGLYRYLSAHTHTTPVSFYRVADGEGRGNGVENRVDKSLMAGVLPSDEKFLDRAIADMLKIFPDINPHSRKPHVHGRITKR